MVVICDEAQYGFKGRLDSKTGRIRYGLAKALRDALHQATFLAFTGTPSSQDDRDTRAIFGNDVSIYDIRQAVEDGATVPVYYESRLVKLALAEGACPRWTRRWMRFSLTRTTFLPPNGQRASGRHLRRSWVPNPA